MRPLHVLILAIVAVLALLFGVFSLLRDDTTPDTTLTPTSVAQPAAPAQRPPADLQGTPTPKGPRETATAESSNREPGSVNTSSYQWDNTLTGLVYNPDSKPLRGVEVTVTEVGSNEIVFANDPVDHSRDITVRTDGDGRYTFRNLEPRDQYILIARHADYSRYEGKSVPVLEVGVCEEPPISLSPGAMLSGHVRDESGAGVSGAALSLDGQGYQSSPYEPPDRLTTKTDAQGYYVIGNVSPGNRMLTVKAQGYGTITAMGLNFVKDQPVPRDVVLKIAEMICGRVIGPNNTGIPGATVIALGFSNTQQSARGDVVTDDKGEFCFNDLAPGPYNLVATAKGYRFERANRTQSNTNNVIIEGFKEAGVCGQVIDGLTGQPVPAFSVRMRFYYGPGTGTAPSEVSGEYASPKGEFCIEGVPGSDYVVEASAPGYAPTLSTNFSVSPGKSVAGITVRLSHGGSMSGRIVDSEGKPVARARIQTHDTEWTDDPFMKALGDGYAADATQVDIRAGEDGRFLIKNLNPYSYQIVVSAPGYTRKVNTDIVVGDGVEQKLGDVSITRGGSLRGTLFDPSGKPLPGGRISLRAMEPMPGGMPTSYGAKSGAEGKFVITNIPSGRYVLSGSRATGAEINPFADLQQNKASEVQLQITDGSETVQNINLKE